MRRGTTVNASQLPLPTLSRIVNGAITSELPLADNSSPDNASLQTSFDDMYNIVQNLLDQFYPERETTVTSGDPPFITPVGKAMLRRKNRLMRAGRIEEADAIARRVRNIIMQKSSSLMRNVDRRNVAKDAWAKVRQLIHGDRNSADSPLDGITLQSLNDHYVAISTDQQ